MGDAVHLDNGARHDVCHRRNVYGASYKPNCLNTYLNTCGLLGSLGQIQGLLAPSAKLVRILGSDGVPSWSS